MASLNASSVCIFGLLLSCQMRSDAHCLSLPLIASCGSLNRIFDNPRLSTPPVLVRDRDQARGRYLAIGHYRSNHALYSHFWYEMQVSALRMAH